MYASRMFYESFEKNANQEQVMIVLIETAEEHVSMANQSDHLGQSKLTKKI
jgi:hypothetical protein